jgi:hypothetical protein
MQYSATLTTHVSPTLARRVTHHHAHTRHHGHSSRHPPPRLSLQSSIVSHDCHSLAPAAVHKGRIGGAEAMVQLAPGVRMDAETLDEAMQVAYVAAKEGGASLKGWCLLEPHT